MWEADAEGAPRRARARLHEVAVVVSPRRVRASDRGLVVVGGDVALSGLAAEAEGLEEAAAAGKGRAGGVLEGVLQDELRWEAEQAGGAGAGAGVGAGEGGAKGGAAAALVAGSGADVSRHFDYFAFEGAAGEPRWSHRAGAFHGEEVAAASEALTPQHSFKLDAEKLAARHYGELSCREFRESVLHALPHQWERPADTRLEEAAFFRHREGVGAQKGQLARAAAARAASKGRGASGKAGPHSNWLLGSHRRHKGRPSARAAARAAEPGGAAARHAHMGANASVPNAIVAHLQQGIEVVHLYTGRALCELHLAQDQLHVDVNGDGVIDHIALSAGGRGASDSDAPLLQHVQTSRHAALGACQARATSGVPPNEELWVADVCARRRAVDEAMLPMRGEEAGGFVNAHGPGAAGLTFAPPAFMPVPRADGSYSHLRGQHGIIGVLSSDGVVTAISSHGARLWQRFMDVAWDEDLNPDFVPSLTPLTLRRHGVPAALLAVGADAAAAVSEHGTELARLSLPSPPLGPPVVADFDGDGLSDLLFVTPAGLFGYTQVQHL
ncbi:hypothetical protein MNEG_11214 [Monoraphidium neglectum]|uniref:FG-GAP repeat-containing protein n=1 Tax=Monoraphidium neglectum TaxID=145388 RepID=A0A0D2M6A2_9CHLO|nr:hypothetical protein MNEG_11214 [Monoraphidium neglectum]KIY96746.1 hypothetical protein MNEG_11214 [Monoraphidium neglectum]|eukprot:XP_013895766.1 hypothetical protein MNEG_11214 [Monoraphidium neglectum]